MCVQDVRRHQPSWRASWSSCRCGDVVLLLCCVVKCILSKHQNGTVLTDLDVGTLVHNAGVLERVPVGSVPGLRGQVHTLASSAVTLLAAERVGSLHHSPSQIGGCLGGHFVGLFWGV